MSLAFSKTQKTGFVVSRPKYNNALLVISNGSRLKLVSVAEQFGLSLALPITMKTQPWVTSLILFNTEMFRNVKSMATSGNCGLKQSTQAVATRQIQHLSHYMSKPTSVTSGWSKPLLSIHSSSGSINTPDRRQ